jgi:hypothetical protein
MIKTAFGYMYKMQFPRLILSENTVLFLLLSLRYLSLSKHLLVLVTPLHSSPPSLPMLVSTIAWIS